MRAVLAALIAAAAILLVAFPAEQPPTTHGLGTIGSVLDSGRGGAPGALAATPADHIWSKRFGDADFQLGLSVAVGGSSSVFQTGGFYGTVDFGGAPLTSAGDSDIFLAKFDGLGDHLWSARFGDAARQSTSAVAADGSGSVLLGGSFEGSVDFGGGPLTSAGQTDIFLAKFDGAGNHLWSKRFGDGVYQQGLSVAVNRSGDVFLAGYFFGTVDFGGGPLTSVGGGGDVFLAKFDGAGNHVWSKRFGDAVTQVGSSVAVDPLGSVLLAGYFEGTVDFGGGPLISAGNGDVFLAKFDAAGSHAWSKRFGDANFERASSVAVSGSDVLLAGYFSSDVLNFGGGWLTSQGSIDMFLAKLDGSGNHLWSRGLGYTGFAYASAIAVDTSGNIVLAGYFTGSVSIGGRLLTSSGMFDYDILMAEFYWWGKHRWSNDFGDASFQQPSGVAVDGSGNALLTGRFEGTVDFGGGALASAGLSDVFLAKFDGQEPGPVGGTAGLPDLDGTTPAVVGESSRMDVRLFIGVAMAMAVAAGGAAWYAKRR